MVDKNGKILYKGYRIEQYGDFPRAVKKDNNVDEKWGYIDKKGKLVIPYQFNDCYSFYNGYAIIEEPINKLQTNGCYIATAIYGTYDCPEVWTLRRYRDNVLNNSLCGRLFIRTYYALSPTLVKWFGNTHWFHIIFLNLLNVLISKLNKNGVEDTPYNDKY